MNYNRQNISEILKGEIIDFKVKSSLMVPISKSLLTLLFGIIMNSIAVVILFTSKCSFNNFLECESSKGLIFIAFILLITGLISLFIAFKNMFSDGPLVIGTPSRMILLYNNKMETFQWTQFIGDINVSGDKDKGTITLKKKSGKYQTNDTGPDTFVPDEVYLVNIERPYEIEVICRRRIQNL